MMRRLAQHIFLVTVNITISDSIFPYFLLDTGVDEAVCNVSKISAFQSCRSEHVHALGNPEVYRSTTNEEIYQVTEKSFPEPKSPEFLDSVFNKSPLPTSSSFVLRIPIQTRLLHKSLMIELEVPTYIQVWPVRNTGRGCQRAHPLTVSTIVQNPNRSSLTQRSRVPRNSDGG
jgi:hypothetical protein